MQGRFKGKPLGGLGAHVGGCGCVRAFGQRCPGPEKIYGLVGKTVGHPPCGNFSPRWALAGRYGPLMVFPSTGVLLAVPCLCRGHPGPCWPAEVLICSRRPLALGMHAPGRCLVSAWRRSWPLLWGGSPWNTHLCLRAFAWGTARPLVAC